MVRDWLPDPVLKKKRMWAFSYCCESFILIAMFSCLCYLPVLPWRCLGPVVWPGRSGQAPLRCSWYAEFVCESAFVSQNITRWHTHGFMSVQVETFTVWWRWDWAAGFRGSNPQWEKEDPLSRASLVGPEEDGDDHFYHHLLYTQAHKELEPITAMLGRTQCYTVWISAPLNHSLVYLSRVNYNWGCKEV